MKIRWSCEKQRREYFSRIVYILLALAVTIPVIIKSRMGAEKLPSAAFSVPNSSSLVSIRGMVKYPGIYEINGKYLTTDVILLAGVAGVGRPALHDAVSSAMIPPGSELNLQVSSAGSPVIEVRPIPAAQRLLLGVRLDINSMNTNDFDTLPGVGPALAAKIIEYRQKNGGIMKVSDLRNVDGIGDIKYERLKQYFK